MIGELTNHLWQSTMFAVAAGLLAFAFRKNRAQIRYGLWLAASLKFLVPFSSLVIFGSHLGWAPAAKKITTQAVSFTVAQITQPFPETLSFVPSAPRAANWPMIAILGVWACGFGLIALLRFKAWLRIRAAVRSSTRLEIPTAVEVRSSPGLLEPGVVGLFKSVLLLPEGIVERLTPPQLAAVLAHEICHVRRRDNLTATTHMLVEAVFWFHPLVWWIGVQLVKERERACDEEVLRLGNESQVYAEGILNVCKFYMESPLACVAGVTGHNLRKRVELIVRNQVGEPLSAARKLLLATAGTVALVLPIVFGLPEATPSRAESQAENATPSAFAFEVATIKPNKSSDDNFSFGFFSEDTFTATGTTLHQVIKGAYGVDDDQIVGAPPWVDSEKYDIRAKLGDSVADKLQKLSPDQLTLAQQRLEQRLLVDRCKLVVHRETRNLPVYALVITKHGAKLHEAKPGDTYPDSPIPKDLNGKSHGNVMMMGRGILRGQGIPIASLVHMLAEQQLGRTVVDKTGLTGIFDFTLKWAPDLTQGPIERPQGTDNTTPVDSNVSIFTAIQEQLGLKLEPQKGPVDVLVIDHVEKPSEN